MLPLYTNASKLNIQKLHKIVMTAARCVIGNYCFKQTKEYILNKVKWLDINKMIKYSRLCIINKILKNKSPISLYNLYINDDRSRSKGVIY